MAFTAAELRVVNQALSRVGASRIPDSDNGNTKNNQYVLAELNYEQTRNSLFRSYEWSFAIGQAVLAQVSNLTLDTEPFPSAWLAGDMIIGISSLSSAEILAVTSPTQYEIIYLTAAFTDAESITNAATEFVYWEGSPVTWEGLSLIWFLDDDVYAGVTGYPLVTTEAPPFHFSYQYELPADFDRLTRNYRGQRWWTIQGNRILTSQATANIEYVKKITDPADFDSLFTEALILSLALKFVGPVAGTGAQANNFREELKQELRDALDHARVVSSNERNNTGYSSWILARYGSGKVNPFDPTKIH